jgi:hypothetical protein
MAFSFHVMHKADRGHRRPAPLFQHDHSDLTRYSARDRYVKYHFE